MTDLNNDYTFTLLVDGETKIIMTISKQMKYIHIPSFYIMSNRSKYSYIIVQHNHFSPSSYNHFLSLCEKLLYLSSDFKVVIMAPRMDLQKAPMHMYV